MYFQLLCLYLGILPNSKKSAPNLKDVSSLTLSMKTPTAAWMEKNSGRCSHIAAKTLPLKNGALLSATANITLNFQEK